MFMVKMFLNGLEREVDMVEPNHSFPGVYNVKATYVASVDLLNRQRLFELLQKQGLEYSGADWDIQHGFNDLQAMGWEAAGRAKVEGKSYIWIGLDGKLVNLEVLPEIVRGISERPIDYAHRILDTAVTFVEKLENYHSLDN